MSANTFLDRKLWETKADAMTMEQHTSLRIISVPHIRQYQDGKDFTPTTLFRKVMALLHLWRERSSQRHALSKLDDRLLSDIGLTRDQVRRERLKYFWQE